jgi:hypothetical protein
MALSLLINNLKEFATNLFLWALCPFVQRRLVQQCFWFMMFFQTNKKQLATSELFSHARNGIVTVQQCFVHFISLYLKHSDLFPKIQQCWMKCRETYGLGFFCSVMGSPLRTFQMVERKIDDRESCKIALTLQKMAFAIVS